MHGTSRTPSDATEFPVVAEAAAVRPWTMRLDPETTYNQPALAAAMNVSERTVLRWRKKRRGTFPRPYYIGGRPCWQGRAVIGWLNCKQEEAAS